MEKIRTIPSSSPLEGIDFNKLRTVLRANWFWLVLIFLSINVGAFLFVRYTKNIYESDSEIKLEVKNDATELGIKTMVEDQNLNLISGEIEIIQSRLFLNRVLDSVKLDVSYVSLGRVLNEELFRNSPFRISYTLSNAAYYNVPFYYEQRDDQTFTLRIGENGKEITGQFNKPLMLDGLQLVLNRNDQFVKGDEVGYYFTINSRDVLLDYLLRNLTAEPLNFNANTIRISFKDHNPFKAQYILNKIDTLYLHYSNQQKNLANKQKIDWLSKELSQIEKKMEGFEDYFENFTLQNKTNNLEADLAKTVNAINKVDSQRYELTQRLSQLSVLIDTLPTANYLLSPSQRQSFPAPLVKMLDDLQILLLEQERIKMSYSEKTFAFRDNDLQVETLRKKTLRQLKEIHADWTNRLQELNKRKQKLENDFANLPDKNTQFSKNLRFYKLNEQFYLTLMQSKSQFEIAQAGTTPDFQILSPASLAAAPIAPKKMLIAGAGFVASLVAMLFFTGIAYLANNKITGLYELERLTDLPVLGVIPVSYKKEQDGLHVVHRPKSMLSESIRTLRTNLDFFHIHGPRKVIAVSSTVSGEGKSFLAMNLGGIIGLSKKKVILIDIDMRKPKRHVPVAVNDMGKGMSTVLIRKHTWQETVLPTELENFHYLPAGPHPPNPAELLMNGEFHALLEDLKQHYDYVIMDTPPVGLVTDGIMAMKHADLSIYVFRANYSRKEFLSNLQRLTAINKFTNITMVLNALPPNGQSRYGYGYYEESANLPFWNKLFTR